MMPTGRPTAVTQDDRTKCIACAIGRQCFSPANPDTYSTMLRACDNFAPEMPVSREPRSAANARDVCDACDVRSGKRDLAISLALRIACNHMRRRVSVCSCARAAFDRRGGVV